MAERPRLLDLFCGAGGAAVGYARAGFEVVGVDVASQPNYPFEFWKGDAMKVLDNLNNFGGLQTAIYDREWDAIHASPPCQAYSTSWKLQANDHPKYIAALHHQLDKMDLPWVIENVRHSPLRSPVLLEGQMFPELRTHRPRYFETNWPLEVPHLRLSPPRNAKMGRKGNGQEWLQIVGNFPDVEAGGKAMGIDWMTRDELKEAIPPAYTKFIGGQLFALVESQSKEAA